MDKDEVMDKVQASDFLNTTVRNLNLLLEKRLVPYVKVFIAGRHGQVFFSKRKLIEWEKETEDEDLAGMSESEKESWIFKKKTNIAIEQEKELKSEGMILRMIYYSRKLKKLLDVKTPGLSEEEQVRRTQSSDMFTYYMDLIPKLQKTEKDRLKKFFNGDMDCLIERFPELFSEEIKAKKRAEDLKPKVERYETLPGTLKPKEENIQVEQFGSQLTKKTDDYLKKE